jgi:hypothetical protein
MTACQSAALPPVRAFVASLLLLALAGCGKATITFDLRDSDLRTPLRNLDANTLPGPIGVLGLVVDRKLIPAKFEILSSNPAGLLEIDALKSTNVVMLTRRIDVSKLPPSQTVTFSVKATNRALFGPCMFGCSGTASFGIVASAPQQPQISDAGRDADASSAPDSGDGETRTADNGGEDGGPSDATAGTSGDEETPPNGQAGTPEGTSGQVTKSEQQAAGTALSERAAGASEEMRAHSQWGLPIVLPGEKLATLLDELQYWDLSTDNSVVENAGSRIARLQPGLPNLDPIKLENRTCDRRGIRDYVGQMARDNSPLGYAPNQLGHSNFYTQGSDFAAPECVPCIADLRKRTLIDWYQQRYPGLPLKGRDGRDCDRISQDDLYADLRCQLQKWQDAGMRVTPKCFTNLTAVATQARDYSAYARFYTREDIQLWSKVGDKDGVPVEDAIYWKGSDRWKNEKDPCWDRKQKKVPPPPDKEFDCKVSDAVIYKIEWKITYHNHEKWLELQRNKSLEVLAQQISETLNKSTPRPQLVAFTGDPNGPGPDITYDWRTCVKQEPIPLPGGPTPPFKCKDQMTPKEIRMRIAFEPTDNSISIDYSVGGISQEEWERARTRYLYRQVQIFANAMAGSALASRVARPPLAVCPDGKRLKGCCTKYDTITSVHSDGWVWCTGADRKQYQSQNPNCRCTK